MRSALLLFVACASGWAFAQNPPELSPDVAGPAQSIADELKTAAQADAAFVAVGLLKENIRSKDLSQALQYPADQLAVVRLTGRQIKDALERSLSLFPSPNPAFLHLAGMEVAFNRDAAPDQRVVSVTINGAPMNPGQTYRVAMPMNLARGGLGYFTVWQKSAIESADSPQTLESVLKGKTAGQTPLRWKG